MAQTDKLILASGSPRRVELLAQAGIEPARLMPMDIDETAKRAEHPRSLARRLSTGKAQAALAAIKGDPRIPENTLLLVSLLGGSPCAFAAQQLFRHKTRKQPFLTRFWMVVAFQVVVAIGWVVLGLPLPG